MLMARIGHKHRPYSFTCVECGRARKAAHPDRKYCTEKCKVVSAKRRKAERDLIASNNSNKSEVDDVPRGQPDEIGWAPPPADGSNSGGGILEGLSAAGAVPAEDPEERVGRQPITAREGVPFARSPVSGLMYIPDQGRAWDEDEEGLDDY